MNWLRRNWRRVAAWAFFIGLILGLVFLGVVVRQGKENKF